MEPAGYQQHVQQRHPGLSATYGCPFGKCKFTSKSQRHFREHLVKHEKFEKVEGGVDPCILPNHELIRYMVADDIGRGFKTVTAAPVTIRPIPKITIAPKVYARPPKTVIRATNPAAAQKTPHYYTSTQDVLLSTAMESTLEFQHLLHHQDFDDLQEEEERYDEEMIEEYREEHEQLLEEYDDGPPILEPFEHHCMPKMDVVEEEETWEGEKEPEQPASPTEGLFLNGFIDEELD